MDNEEITLSKEMLKAISSDSRISILKSLLERQKTLTEIANELSLSKPTVLAHMEQLEKTGLIEQIQGDNKWKYYSLTKTGRKIVEKQRMSIILLLGTAIIASIGSIMIFVLNRPTDSETVSSKNVAVLPPASKALPAPTTTPDIPIELVIATIAIIIILWAIYVLMKKKID